VAICVPRLLWNLGARLELQIQLVSMSLQSVKRARKPKRFRQKLHPHPEARSMKDSNQSYADVVVTPAAEALQSTPEPGLTRLIGAYNEKLFLAEHRMEKG
jgi:hypothetical protein